MYNRPIRRIPPLTIKTQLPTTHTLNNSSNTFKRTSNTRYNRTIIRLTTQLPSTRRRPNTHLLRRQASRTTNRHIKVIPLNTIRAIKISSSRITKTLRTSRHITMPIGRIKVLQNRKTKGRTRNNLSLPKPRSTNRHTKSTRILSTTTPISTGRNTLKLLTQVTISRRNRVSVQTRHLHRHTHHRTFTRTTQTTNRRHHNNIPLSLDRASTCTNKGPHKTTT